MESTKLEQLLLEFSDELEKKIKDHSMMNEYDEGMWVGFQRIQEMFNEKFKEYLK